MCPWYTVGGKMGDKNLEKRINAKFCARIGECASEALALLTLAYGEADPLFPCHQFVARQ
jgi:hypothetical protein